MWIEILTVRLEFHLWIRYLFASVRLGFGWTIWSVEKIWMWDLDRHDPKKETAFDGACAASIVASLFWSQLWRRQWPALALLLRNSHGNWARNLPYLLLPEAVTAVVVRLHFFLFVFRPVFAELEQFNGNGFGLTCSHWLAVVLPLSPLFIIWNI